MCIFANEGGPKSKSSRKETPLKIQKYKEIHVSGKNLEKKMFLGMSAPTPSVQALFMCRRIQLCMICGGVQATFSVLEPSEVKFPALRGFVLPTDIHVSRGTRLGFTHLKKLFFSNPTVQFEFYKNCGYFTKIVATF